MVHKIDGPGAGPGSTFVEASPGIPKTVATSKWLNMVQEELIGLLEAAGIVPNDADDTQVRAALDVLFGSSGASALKNRLINGAAQVWQRGTSIAVGNLETYTADRWAAIADQSGAGSGAATISRQPFTDGQTAVPGDPPFFLRWAQTSAGTAGSPVLVQKVEDVSQLAGQSATLSLYGRSDATTLATLRLVQRFGAGGSADVVVGSFTFALGPSWTRTDATFLVPSLAGKTIGTGSHLRFEIVLPAAATFTVELVDLQLEAGDNPTPFERRALQLEHALCLRFFEKSYRFDVTPGTAAATARRIHEQTGAEPPGTDFWLRDAGARFRVQKRARPTMTWYGTEGAGLLPNTVSIFAGFGGGAFVSNVAVTSTRETGETATGFPVIAASAGNGAGAPNWTADAEL